MGKHKRFQSREAVEQGIGGRGGQHLVPGFSEELEEIGVGLARGSRQDEVIRGNRVPRGGEGGGERLPSSKTRCQRKGEVA